MNTTPALPHDLLAEQALLGAILFDNETLNRLTAAIRPAHFFDPVHGRIFAACADLINAGKLADGVTLKQRFATDGGLDEIGGSTYLMRLMENAAALSNQSIAYADLIVDLARRRALLTVVREAEADILAAHEDSSVTQAALELRLSRVASEEIGGDGFEVIGDITRDVIANARRGLLKGISTGFRELDDMINGIEPGRVTMVGGASGMGKSVFGSALGRNIAAQGYVVAENHLEMDRSQIGLRAATALGAYRDSAHRYANPHYLSASRGDLTPEQWDRLRFGVDASVGLPVYVDARPRRPLSVIESGARRLFRRLERAGKKPGALIIDHEALIPPEPGERYGSQLERTNARAEGLLAMAKNLDVGLIALCQITKEGKRADGEERLPDMDDLKYGGALAEAAKNVILLHRPAYYAARKPKHLRTEADFAAIASRDCTIIVGKARGGRTGQMTVLMDMPSAGVFELGETLS